jgi:predicted metal-dependent RNase
MAWYEKEEKPRVILKGLKKLGLVIKHANNHDTALCVETQCKTTVPRHVPLDKYVVGSIYEFLIENGFEKESIKRAFKW